MPPEPSPILIIGIGNPSRGDDALGPLLIERLEELALPDVELLTDFQLQVEFSLDLQQRQQVLFVDASLNAAPPFTFTQVIAAEDTSYSSHALSPSAVLHAYQKLFGEPPPSYVLAIRGEAFEMGEGLSKAAENHLEAALEWLQHILRSSVAAKSAAGKREDFERYLGAVPDVPAGDDDRI